MVVIDGTGAFRMSVAKGRSPESRRWIRQVGGIAKPAGEREQFVRCSTCCGTPGPGVRVWHAVLLLLIQCAVWTGVDGVDADSDSSHGKNIMLPEIALETDASKWHPNGRLTCQRSSIALHCFCRKNCANVVSTQWLWVPAHHSSSLPASAIFSNHPSIRHRKCLKLRNITEKVSSTGTITLGCLTTQEQQRRNGTLICRLKAKNIGSYRSRCFYSSIDVQFMDPIFYPSQNNTVWLLDGLAYALCQPSRVQLYHSKPRKPHHVSLSCHTYANLVTYWSFQRDLKSGRAQAELKESSVPSDGSMLRIARFDKNHDNGLYTCHSTKASLPQSLAFHLVAQHNPPIDVMPVIIVTPSSHLWTYTGQNVTVKCFSPGYHRAVLSWAIGDIRKEQAQMWREPMPHTSTDAIIIQLGNVQKDMRFRCRARLPNGKQNAVVVHVTVRAITPLPKLNFWVEEHRDLTALGLRWQGDTTGLSYMVEKWTVSYRKNSSGPWLLAPGGGYLTNKGNAEVNNVTLRPYYPSTVYHFRIRVARTNLTQDPLDHIRRFQTVFESPLVVNHHRGPVSGLLLLLQAHRGKVGEANNISCSDWIGDDYSCQVHRPMQTYLIESVSRFISTICASCQLHKATESSITCVESRHIQFRGILLFPGVHRQYIDEYMRLLSNGQLSVTLSVRVPILDCLKGNHRTQEWLLDIAKVCVDQDPSSSKSLVAQHCSYLPL